MDEENNAMDDATDSEYVPDDPEDLSDDELQSSDEKRFSSVWKHFTRLSKDVAKCNYCHKDLSCKSTSANLRRHIQNRCKMFKNADIHGSKIGTAAVSEDLSDDELHTSDTKQLSSLWKHFTRLSKDLAKCNYCHKKLSCKTTSANLRRHIQNRCKMLSNADDDGSENDTAAVSEDLSDDEPCDEKQFESSWKHFTRLSKDVAKCNYCHKDLSCKTTSANLKKHIRNHCKMFTNDDNDGSGNDTAAVRIEFQQYIPSEDDINLVGIAKPRRGPGPSEAWVHFDKLPGFLARCKYCQSELSYRTTITNLKKHVIRKHQRAWDLTRSVKIIEKKNVVEERKYSKQNDSDQEINETVVSKNNIDQSDDTQLTFKKEEKGDIGILKKRLHPSLAWDHFIKISSTIAECKYCQSKLSFKTTVSNLKNHLRSRHNKIWEYTKAMQAEMGYSSYFDPPRKRKRNYAWDYFIKKSRTVAKCKICLSLLSFRSTVGNLKRHLMYKHKKAYKAVKNSEESESESNSDADVPSTKLNKPYNVMKYYDNLDEINKCARCVICEASVSFVTTTSSLDYHLMAKHSDVTNLKFSDVSKDATEAKIAELRAKRKSGSFQYFDIKDPDLKIATCRFCSRDLCYTTVSNLKKHLFRQHGVRVPPCTMYHIKTKELNVTKEAKPRPKSVSNSPQFKLRSSIWQHFEIVDSTQKIAKCNLCQRNLAYTYLSNLNKHLTRKHKGAEAECTVVENSNLNTAVWAFYKCLDDVLNIASCLICKKRIEYNDCEELASHLRRKHPNVDLEGILKKPKKIMITDSGELFEIDDGMAKPEPGDLQEERIDDDDGDSDGWNNHEEEIEALHSVEYLEDEFTDVPQYPSPKNVVKENPLKRKRSQPQPKIEENSLDIFGKYMVSLLKKLPKQKADKLQVEFVRQIMEAQTVVPNTTSKSQVQNNRYENGDACVSSNSEIRVITSDGLIENQEVANVVCIPQS